MEAGAWNGKIFLFTWSYATNSLSMMQLSTSWAKVSLTTCAIKVTQFGINEGYRVEQKAYLTAVSKGSLRNSSIASH